MAWMPILRAWLGRGGGEKLLFVLGLCFLAFAFGTATIHWKVFPYPIVNKAFTAVDAWRQLSKDKLPPQIMAWETAGRTNSPVRQLSGHAGAEALLVVGGFYSRLDLCPK